MFDRAGIDPHDFNRGVMSCPGVLERLVKALVGVLELDVLADDTNTHVVTRVNDASQHRTPFGHLPIISFEGQFTADQAIELFSAEFEGDFIN